ncbi:MAG: division/cell wall cluster transcriptional repressor MraZ [Chitinophagaceae bacterium]|nr:division/cell wall cluster transcriptional repressor MraZ [Chitinophagaceae bacterium]
MIGLRGEFEATVDGKGRFLLPSAIRKQLPEDGSNRFVINRGFEKCLALYPMDNWKPKFEAIGKLNDFDPKVRQFKRYFLNGATDMELDSAGRLLLPQSLKEHAGIDKDIVLLASYDKIEIWDKTKYNEFFESMTAENFSDLAKEVLPNGLNL